MVGLTESISSRYDLKCSQSVSFPFRPTMLIALASMSGMEAKTGDIMYEAKMALHFDL